MAGFIDINTLDANGSFRAYEARPDQKPRGAIIVIQEIFGVNAGIRGISDHWARQGYIAIAPDLFWRDEAGVELNADDPEDLQKAFGYMQRLDQDKAIADLEATIKHARAAGADRIGVVGYCMGGRLAFMAAARTDSDATVGYYGVGIDGLLGEAHAIAKPLLLHFAEADGFVPPEQVQTIKEGLKGQDKVTIYTYPGVDHGFATNQGSRRVESAAREAEARTEAFFDEHIG